MISFAGVPIGQWTSFFNLLLPFVTFVPTKKQLTATSVTGPVGDRGLAGKRYRGLVPGSTVAAATLGAIDASSGHADDTQAGSQCPVWWTRDAAQFSAAADADCAEDPGSPITLSLAQQQLWWGSRRNDSAVKLHRSRAFTCYADIPGVGGGRDEPYTRYDNLSLHDQGAETWFTDKDGRTLRLRLFNVDWPINNYEGYFTRDSLVIYVVEKFDDGSTKEHGYAFTLPEANRIGINLKWLLGSCFMLSGKVDTPTM